MIAVDANNPHAVAMAERREWRRLTQAEIADAVIAEHRRQLKGLTPEFEARIRARFE